MTVTHTGAPVRPANATWWHGRGELVVAALVLGLAIFLGIGTVTMDVPAGAGVPGPQFFPTIVTAGLAILGVLLAVRVIRHPEAEVGAGGSDDLEMDAEMLGDLGDIDTTSEIRVVASATGEDVPRTGTDWKTFAMVLAGLIGFVIILVPVGWILAGAALFWVIAHALGSKRPVFDIAIAILMSSAIQLAFSAGLGLTLPSGLLAGVFSWIS
ncbi:tripartite tricarboxylate transporter TctB family protein [Mycetocola tolaasinivorans]|uniref:Tripartite tricarboxylate transporter TctB family protein n=1 Tax=Mycetocola tolaasinivorans TaxID=76635 RepID=A0A3L7ADR9_9MICO|nr:tripartite tricarboxylate transporter TctB family protein [Mycetocola tolaasinivorans]RLP77791.1 tripartite tricarboxylate transporter TctB family protein [Mycetocola tolaasinivorans]